MTDDEARDFAKRHVQRYVESGAECSHTEAMNVYVSGNIWRYLCLECKESGYIKFELKPDPTGA